MHNIIVPQLTLASIALNLDAPDAPPIQPPDAAHAVDDMRRFLARCQMLLSDAQTAPERAYAQFWIINAERQLERWQAALERQAVTR